MKVLLCHNNYRIQGGADVFYHEVGRVLSERGHEVAYLSSFDESIVSEWSSYFPKALDYKSPRLADVARGLSLFYSGEAKATARRLVGDFKPDIAHVFGISTKLTPSILDAFSTAGVPVVASMNDYKHICPNSKLFHHNNLCEDCRYGNFFKAIENRCCHDSLLWSSASAIEAYIHGFMDIYRKNVKLFLFASEFMARKTESFWGRDTFCWRIVKNPFNSRKYAMSERQDGYALCFGRIVEEKGIDSLIRALAISRDVKLKLVGDGPLSANIAELANSLGLDNVQFLGPRWGNEMEDLLAGAHFTVVPSKWHENFPYVIVQSFAMGKPVIGSDRGGIPEMIEDQVSGIVYDATDIGALAESLSTLWNDKARCLEMGKRAKEYADTEYSDVRFYDSLMSAYTEALR